MKAKVLSADGKKLHEIEMPSFFNERIREDIILKVYNAEQKKQPYAPNIVAGMQHSASGKIRHARRKWKTAYGYGISRVPRKIHTRRGSRFFWVGATISSARGGRQAHPPKTISMLTLKKINKKEKTKAMLSALSATSSLDSVKKRYSRINNLDSKKTGLSLPIIFESKILELNTKEFSKLINQILGDFSLIAKKEKKQRAGKGKSRGRKYKSTRGILLVTASDENPKFGYFDVSNAQKLGLRELAPGGISGRLVAYTEKAISQLEKRFGRKPT